MTITLTSLRHRDVLAVDTATVIARVEGLVLDDDHRSVAALVVGKGPKGATVLPWARVVAIGPDAVTVDGVDALRAPASDRETRYVDGTIDPVGVRVLSDEGNAGGSLSDLQLDPVSGALVGLVVDGDVLEADRLVGIGDHAAVLRR